MNDATEPTGDEVVLKRLRCNRTGQQYDLERHQRCPYCWGGREDVERGRHEGFCSFDPKRDPLHFGFPPNVTRDDSG